MKKLETLVNEITKAIDKKTKIVIDDEMTKKLKAIAENEAVSNLESLVYREALALLQYVELQKALSNKKYTLILDMNYEKCRAKEINFFRYSLLDTHRERTLHIYQHTNTFDICFSADKNTRAKIEAIADRDSRLDTKQADTSVYKKVHFDEMLTICKYIIALLESADILQSEEQSESEAQ